MNKENKEQKTTLTKPKEKALTIASAFQELAIKGAKDKKVLATKIFTHLKNKGVEKNVRGKAITEEKVLTQINNMVRDIKQERGKNKNGWWAKYTVISTETEFKLVAKQ